MEMENAENVRQLEAKHHAKLLDNDRKYQQKILDEVDRYTLLPLPFPLPLRSIPSSSHLLLVPLLYSDETIRYHQLLHQKEEMQEDFERQMVLMKQSHSKAVQDLSEDYESKYKEEVSRIEKGREEKDDLMRYVWGREGGRREEEGMVVLNSV